MSGGPLDALRRAVANGSPVDWDAIAPPRPQDAPGWTRPVDLSRHPARSMRRYRDRTRFAYLRAALAGARARRLNTRAAWDRAYRLGSEARELEQR